MHCLYCLDFALLLTCAIWALSCLNNPDMQCTTLQMTGATFIDLWKTMGPAYNNTFGTSLREVSQLRGIYIHHRNMHKNVNISAEASPIGFSFF